MRKFFDILEAHAKKERYAHTVFMTVTRSVNHVLTPENYQSLDQTWKHFGYEQVPDLQVHLTWPQVDTHQNTPNTLAIWQKPILKS